MNMLETIIPKSDQLNADDLIGGKTMTIRITGVDVKMDEQPVSIHFEGDGGKPYKPGKSMRRVLVNVWGPDAKAYTGRRLTLYRDDTVKFGGMEVGGIRISHMSHIQKSVTMALTATKAQRRPFTVQPLVEREESTPSQKAESAAPKKITAAEWIATLNIELEAAQTREAVDAIVARDNVQKALAGFKNESLETLKQRIAAAEARTTPIENDPALATDDEEFLPPEFRQTAA